MIAAHLREAASGDAAAVANIFLACRHPMAEDGIVPFVHSDEETRDTYIPDVVLRRMTVTVAVMSGAVRAFVATTPGEVEHLYVHPDWQGRGLGTVLLKHAMHSADGERGLALWTFEGNLKARRFYERHGFAAVARTDGARNEEKTPDIRYAWGR